MREKMVDRAFSASTALTRPSSSAPERRSARVRLSGVTDSGKASLVIAWRSLPGRSSARKSIVRGPNGGGRVRQETFELCHSAKAGRSLVRRHSPSKDGRLSPPDGATFFQREKGPRGRRVWLDPRAEFLSN